MCLEENVRDGEDEEGKTEILLSTLSPLQGIPTVTGPLPLASVIGTPCPIAAPLPPHPFMGHPILMPPPCTVTLPAPYHKPNASVYSFGLDSFPSQLDSLDSLSLSEPQPGVLLCLVRFSVKLLKGDLMFLYSS